MPKLPPRNRTHHEVALRLLHQLYHNPNGQTKYQLLARLHLNNNALKPHLAELQELRFIEIAANGHHYNIIITDKGKQYLQEQAQAVPIFFLTFQFDRSDPL